MRVAITGGTGFVGRHLARELVARGHQAVLIARGKMRATNPSTSCRKRVSSNPTGPTRGNYDAAFWAATQWRTVRVSIGKSALRPICACASGEQSMSLKQRV